MGLFWCETASVDALLSESDQANALAFLAMGNPEPGTERFAKRCRVLLKKLAQTSPFYQALDRQMHGELTQDLSLPQPFQPLIERGRHREFLANALVQRIVRHTPWKHMPFLGRFSVNDRIQLAQLLGMRMSVFVTLPFVSRTTLHSLATAAASSALAAPPVQPLQMAGGELVFQGNALVRFLLKESSWTLSELQAFPGSATDFQQLQQLLGSPVAGMPCQV